jgi:hypothetical protein
LDGTQQKEIVMRLKTLRFRLQYTFWMTRFRLCKLFELKRTTYARFDLVRGITIQFARTKDGYVLYEEVYGGIHFLGWLPREIPPHAIGAVLAFHYAGYVQAERDYDIPLASRDSWAARAADRAMRAGPS